MGEREDILEEALRITSGDRRRDYDHPLPNHQRIALLWNAYEGIKPEGQRGADSPQDVAAKMILLKLARHVFTPKRDNLVDVCGYARCIALMDEAGQAEAEGSKHSHGQAQGIRKTAQGAGPLPVLPAHSRAGAGAVREACCAAHRGAQGQARGETQCS
jgi:hypothetical protein